MKNIIDGKVDEHTAIVSADVFAPEKMEAMMSDPEFQKIDQNRIGMYLLNELLNILIRFMTIKSMACTKEMKNQ